MDADHPQALKNLDEIERAAKNRADQVRDRKTRDELFKVRIPSFLAAVDDQSPNIVIRIVAQFAIISYALLIVSLKISRHLWRKTKGYFINHVNPN